MRTLILILLFAVSVYRGYSQQGMLLVGDPVAAPPATLLLDTYTGAKAAYATVKLRADADSCMVIRRSSDNATTLIGFSGDDIDEAAINTHCSGANCFVVRWSDQTGNGNDVIQSTTTRQPKLYDSTTGIVYENSVVALDFANDYLKVTFSSSISQPTSYFCVISNRSIGNQNVPVGGITGENRQIPYSTVFGNNYAYAGANLFSSNAATTDQQLISTLFGDTDYLYKNSTLDASGNAGSGGQNGLTIGDRFSLTEDYNGYIQAVVIYPSDQSANRTAIETIINNYYSIY